MVRALIRQAHTSWTQMAAVGTFCDVGTGAHVRKCAQWRCHGLGAAVLGACYGLRALEPCWEQRVAGIDESDFPLSHPMRGLTEDTPEELQRCRSAAVTLAACVPGIVLVGMDAWCP